MDLRVIRGAEFESAATFIIEMTFYISKVQILPKVKGICLYQCSLVYIAYLFKKSICLDVWYSGIGQISRIVS